MLRANLRPLCGLVLACGLVFGQTPPDPPTPPSATERAAHEVSFLTQMLSLSSDQQTKASQIFTTEATSEAGLRSSMEAARTALTQAVDANDPSGMANATTQIGALTAQEMLAHATARAAFQAILSSDQLPKFKALRGPGGHGMGPGGPGMGPGGPGGPPPPPPPPGM